MVGYDTGMLNGLGSEDAVETWIDAVWTHTQAGYCDSTLTSSVLVEKVGVKHYDESKSYKNHYFYVEKIIITKVLK